MEEDQQLGILVKQNIVVDRGTNGALNALVDYTLTTKDRHGVLCEGRIRRLTPRECLRLQGLADDRIDTVLAIQSDNQAYKQAGNGVTVHVVEAIGRRIAKMDAELRGEALAP